MAVTDPRKLISILEDLTEEIRRFTTTVNDTAQAASHCQQQAQERISQGKYKVGILQNSVSEDEVQIAQVNGEVSRQLSLSYQAVDEAHQTLDTANNVHAVATATLKKWEKELQIALRWLQQAEIRLAQAIAEYNAARTNLARAENNLAMAQAALTSCRNTPGYTDSNGKYHPPPSCNREETAVAAAIAEVRQAQNRLQKAEYEVTSAKAEVAQAQARVDCCQNAVNLSQKAVQISVDAIADANESMIYGERSLEEAKAAEKSVNLAQDKAIEERENLEKLIGAVNAAQEVTQQAQIYYQQVTHLAESTYQYAKLGNKEIENRRNILYQLNRSESILS